MNLFIKTGIICFCIFLLTSIDFNYEWLSPIESQGETVQWFSSVGFRGGLLGSFNDETGIDGRLNIGFQLPRFFPLPFAVGAGPEGGVIAITNWFIALLAGLCYFFWQRKHSNSQQGTSQNYSAGRPHDL
jgi:hypothetical protein